MKKGFYYILAAQFFSSLADNALFIAAIALIKELNGPLWMPPAIKWFFAFTYVFLSPFVGAFADSFPKGKVMLGSNGIKILGCFIMYFYTICTADVTLQAYLIAGAYALVGIGAAAYSPAKYGIITELLPPHLLVKGNAWIEGLTVISIILGFVLGGFLISEPVSNWLLAHEWIARTPWGAKTPAEAAMLVIAIVYIIASLFNLAIPNTGARYPKQGIHPIKLTKTFIGYIKVLWADKIGQISLAVTTIFWGAGATLQLIVIDWGETQLGLPLNESSMLMGITAFGTIGGAMIAGRIVPLKLALNILPVSILMGLVVMLMPSAHETWYVYFLLVMIGLLSGLFVVPMNALLQHRGHVLLSAGHSIAVQNFNEQLNILFMVGLYMILGFFYDVNTIIYIFGSSICILMLGIIGWNYVNFKRNPQLGEQIGSNETGRSLNN